MKTQKLVLLITLLAVGLALNTVVPTFAQEPAPDTSDNTDGTTFAYLPLIAYSSQTQDSAAQEAAAEEAIDETIDAAGQRKCEFDLDLSTGHRGQAEVTIKGKKLKIEIDDALPNTLYTVWIDFRSRATGQLAADYPLAKGAEPRGVAPAFATTAGVTSGMGFDPNSIVTNRKGDAEFSITLDYEILKAGDSPVVAGKFAMQGLNLIGGGWLRDYPVDPNQAPSLQKVDPVTGLPLLPRSTVQGITIVGHPDKISHGHTPGVAGVDHFGGWQGDFPSGCR